MHLRKLHAVAFTGWLAANSAGCVSTSPSLLLYSLAGPVYIGCDLAVPLYICCSSVNLLQLDLDWRSWLLAARQIWGESTQTKSPEGGTGSVCVHSAQRGRGGSSHYYAAAGIGFENDSHGATCAVGDLSLNCLNPVHSHKITEHFIILVPMSRGVSLTD